MPMSSERKAGIFFTVAVIALLALIVGILSTSRARGFEYTVVFDDGKGLQKGDHVQLNGVDIGIVREVRLDRTGESIQIDLEIDHEHREKIKHNSTAYIRDATFPNVSGQKVVEVINSAEPSTPLPAKSIVMGKNSLAEVKAWQFKEQVGTWSEQLRGMAEDLSEAAKSGFHRGKQALAPKKDQPRDRWETPADEGLEEGEYSLPEIPERDSVDESQGAGENGGPESSMPAETESSYESPAVRKFQTQEQGLAGASDLLKQFHGSEEYQALADRTIDILRRLSDRGVTSALAGIVLDWKELKQDLLPAIQVLKDAGRLAMADQLERMMEAVEEMIRLRQQQLEEERHDNEQYHPVSPTPEVIEI